MLPSICLFIAPTPARDSLLRQAPRRQPDARPVPGPARTAAEVGQGIRLGLEVLADAAGFALLLGGCYALVRIMEMGFA